MIQSFYLKGKMVNALSTMIYEILTHDAMPCWVVLLVELLLDESSDILLNIVFLKRLCSNINSVLLHLFSHVRILDDCFSFRHFLLPVKTTTPSAHNLLQTNLYLLLAFKIRMTRTDGMLIAIWKTTPTADVWILNYPK